MTAALLWWVAMTPGAGSVDSTNSPAARNEWVERTWKTSDGLPQKHSEHLLKRERISLGLAGMRERVLILGGELDIESGPGRGTTIVVWAPLKKEGT